MTLFTAKNSLRAALAFGVLLIAAAITGSLPHPSEVQAAPNLDAGATLFHERGCEHCHGVNGVGGGLGPDLSGVGKRLKKPQIEHQIHDGGGGMPAFGEVLQPDEITALVEFLHAKRSGPKNPKPVQAPAPTPPVDPND
jgi:mono/diheme cytochrome c family protein